MTFSRDEIIKEVPRWLKDTQIRSFSKQVIPAENFLSFEAQEEIVIFKASHSEFESLAHFFFEIEKQEWNASGVTCCLGDFEKLLAIAEVSCFESIEFRDIVSDFISKHSFGLKEALAPFNFPDGTNQCIQLMLDWNSYVLFGIYSDQYISLHWNTYS